MYLVESQLNTLHIYKPKIITDMKTKPVTVNVSSELYQKLIELQEQKRETEGKKTALSEILVNLAYEGIQTIENTQNEADNTQNLGQNTQENFQNTQNKEYTYDIKLQNEEDFKIKRFKAFKLKAGQRSKQILIIETKKRLFISDKKDTALKVKIDIFTLENKDMKQTKELAFVYPRTDLLD